MLKYKILFVFLYTSTQANCEDIIKIKSINSYIKQKQTYYKAKGITNIPTCNNFKKQKTKKNSIIILPKKIVAEIDNKFTREEIKYQLKYYADTKNNDIFNISAKKEQIGLEKVNFKKVVLLKTSKDITIKNVKQKDNNEEKILYHIDKDLNNVK